MRRYMYRQVYEMLEMLAILFVMATGFIALAIILPIIFWHERQTVLMRQPTATYRFRYATPTPTPAMFQTKSMPPTVPKKLILERWIYA